MQNFRLAHACLYIFIFYLLPEYFSKFESDSDSSSGRPHPLRIVCHLYISPLNESRSYRMFLRNYILKAISVAFTSIAIAILYFRGTIEKDGLQFQANNPNSCQSTSSPNNFLQTMFGFGKSVCIFSGVAISNLPKISIANKISSPMTMTTKSKNEEWRNASNIYDFTVKDLDDQDVKLDKYKGKVLLVVNVASKCGLTKTNYKELNELHSKYSDQGLAILGFPSNSFAQEPGCSVDLKEYKKKNNVEWDMFAKIDVNGDKADPLYQWLKTKCGGTLIDAIKWNFTKFLVNKKGEPVARFAPNKPPMELEADIKAELDK